MGWELTLLLKVLDWAGGAVTGQIILKLLERGYPWAREQRARLSDAMTSQDEAATANVRGQLKARLLEHPEDAQAVVAELLQPSQSSTPGTDSRRGDAPLITVLEGYLALVLGMAAQTPPQVAAVRGSLLGPESLTVIDTRSRWTSLYLPRQVGPWPVLVLLPNDDEYGGSAPRMWVGLPPEGHPIDELVQRLNETFAHPIGAPEWWLASPDRLCAATLSELCGLGTAHSRRFGRVAKVQETTIGLDDQTDIELAAVPPPTREDRLRETAAAIAAGRGWPSPAPPPRPGELAAQKQRLNVEHAAAGLGEPLTISGDGMQVLAQQVRHRLLAAQAQQARETHADRKVKDDIALAAAAAAKAASAGGPGSRPRW